MVIYIETSTLLERLPKLQPIAMVMNDHLVASHVKQADSISVLCYLCIEPFVIMGRTVGRCYYPWSGTRLLATRSAKSVNFEKVLASLALHDL